MWFSQSYLTCDTIFFLFSYLFIFCMFLSVLISELLSPLVERFSVFCMRDFSLCLLFLFYFPGALVKILHNLTKELIEIALLQVRLSLILINKSINMRKKLQDNSFHSVNTFHISISLPTLAYYPKLTY